MTDHEKQMDLTDLELRLQNRPACEPSTALQFRVMQAVSAELRASSSPVRPRMSFLAFAGAMAAALLVAVNLSFTAASARLFDARPAAARQQTLEDASAIQKLSPDLSRSEAVRLSLLLHGGAHLAPLPDVKASARDESARHDMTPFPAWHS